MSKSTNTILKHQAHAVAPALLALLAYLKSTEQTSQPTLKIHLLPWSRDWRRFILQCGSTNNASSHWKTAQSDQCFRELEARCAALAERTDKLLAKTSDLESRSRRNNIRIVGLPESIEGPRPTVFFAELLVERLGSENYTISS